MHVRGTKRVTVMEGRTVSIPPGSICCELKHEERINREFGSGITIRRRKVRVGSTRPPTMDGRDRGGTKRTGAPPHSSSHQNSIRTGRKWASHSPCDRVTFIESLIYLYI